MHLTAPLSLEKTTVDDIAFHPAKDKPTCVLTVSGVMTPEHADLLGKKTMLFEQNGVSRSFEGSIRLGLDIESAEATLSQHVSLKASTVSFRPKSIKNLSVYHASPKSQDHSLRLRMAIHTKSNATAKELLEFLDFINKGEFSLEVEPRQDKLFEPTEPTAEATAEKKGAPKNKAKKK